MLPRFVCIAGALAAAALSAKAQFAGCPAYPGAAPYINGVKPVQGIYVNQPFSEVVKVCNVPAGSSLTIDLAIVNGDTNAPVFSGQAATDANGFATIYVNPGLPAGHYQYTASDAANHSDQSGGIATPQTSPDSQLVGQVVFLFVGAQADSSPAAMARQTHIAGNLVADGYGHITSGEADANSPLGVKESIPLAGSYTLDATGRGTLTLVSSIGTLTFALSVGDNGQASFISTPGSLLVGSGILSEQNANALSSPRYGANAAHLSGETACNAVCVSAGGHASLVITTGVVCFGCQQSQANGLEPYVASYDQVVGTTSSLGVKQSGTTSVPDTFGRAVLIATSSSDESAPKRFVTYTIDGYTLYLLSLDAHDVATVVSGTANATN